MWYVPIILMIVVVAGLLFIPKPCLSNNSGTENKKTVSSGEVAEMQSDTIQPLFSKEQIEKKLKRLATTPPPKKLSWGAMCYEMAMPPDTVSYICPDCGERTAYTYKRGKSHKDNKNSEEVVRFLQWELSACKREIQRIKGIQVYLDESEFCRHCSPHTTEPALYLIVNINNSNTVKTRDVTCDDIKLIREFMDDELTHKDYVDAETPLVNYIKCIKELLGIKEK